MHRQLLVPVLLAVALAAATGRISHSNELAAADADSPTRLAPLAIAARASADAARDAEGAESEVSHELAVSAEGGVVRFELKLTNESGRRLELNFPDGYTHDVTVLDAAGREVWRWSRGRLFTQTIRNRMLGAEESFVVVEQWKPDGLRGTFTAVVELRSTNFPVAERAGFRLP